MVLAGQLIKGNDMHSILFYVLFVYNLTNGSSAVRIVQTQADCELRVSLITTNFPDNVAWCTAVTN